MKYCSTKTNEVSCEYPVQLQVAADYWPLATVRAHSILNATEQNWDNLLG